MLAIRRGLLDVLCPGGRRARLMIFTYHRVLEHADPLLPGSPTAQRFERELQRIRKYCTPLALSEAIERLTGDDLPPRAVTVTFDDGYHNNLTVAAPLLARYEVPATLFVAVDAVERGIMWNDVVIEAVRAAPERLDARSVGLDVLATDPPNKIATLSRVLTAVKYQSASKRMELAETLYRSVASAPLARQMLRSSELRELTAFGFELGAHTVNHPILKALSDAAAWAEIDGSRTWLREQTGVEPTLFAYPNGKRDDDYDERHPEIVRSLGFRAAVSTNWGCATHRSPTFELPRFKPWEDSDLGFYSRLCKVAARSYW